MRAEVLRRFYSHAEFIPIVKLRSIILLMIFAVIIAGVLIPTVSHGGPSKENQLTGSQLSPLNTTIGLYKQAYKSDPKPIEGHAWRY